MLILDRLWQGNVIPGERRYRPSSAYSPYFRKMKKSEETLKAELSETGKQAFEDFVDAEGMINSMGACDSFMSGFRIAVLIMLDVFYPTEGEQNKRV